MKAFTQCYGYEPDFCVFAPARVNLIGEHIDYCGGHVLPMAIAQGTTIWGAVNNSSHIRLFSAREQAELQIDPATMATATTTAAWQRYVQGVLTLLCAQGRVDEALVGGDYLVEQNIGSAGLSSSASFCAALALAFGRIDAREDAERIALARLCQQVEHEFAGVNCGIMDQMSVMMGHVIHLDCQSLRFEQIKFATEEVAIVIMDTGAERTLAASGYNQRIDELGEIARAKGLAGIESMARMDISASGLSARLGRRLKHVQSEHRRVSDSYQALQKSDWKALGALMNASHDSLKNDYEVSCEPLDTMVALAQAHPGVLGARMTGGGFGGCAVALVRKDAIEDVMTQIAPAYEHASGLEPNLFIASSNPGASFTFC